MNAYLPLIGHDCLFEFCFFLHTKDIKCVCVRKFWPIMLQGIALDGWKISWKWIDFALVVIVI